MRLPVSLRAALYATGAVVLGSGVAWLVARDPTRPGLATASMEIHGGAAMVLLVLVGAVSALHAATAWREGKNRWSGTAVAAVVTVLILTGFLLYYLGDEDMRGFVSIVHWTVGVAAAALLSLHVWLGVRAAKAVNCAPRPAPGVSARARSSP
jgi:multisubunit Na+/H+ antiporter MnhC subunit